MTAESGWYFARGEESVGPLSLAELVQRLPGEVWCQSLPFSRLAGRIVAAAGKPGGKEEGSILGGLGTLLGGDNG